MAIRTVVTRGFGNGTFSGTIPLVVTRGYSIGEAVEAIVGGCFKAGSVYHPGFKAGSIYAPGFTEGEAYLPGFKAGQGAC